MAKKKSDRVHGDARGPQKAPPATPEPKHKMKTKPPSTKKSRSK